jgi:hypothetical protein
MVVSRFRLRPLKGVYLWALWQDHQTTSTASTYRPPSSLTMAVEAGRKAPWVGSLTFIKDLRVCSRD